MHRITDQHLFDLAENRASVTPWDSTRMARELAASRKVIESIRAAKYWKWDHREPIATNVTAVVFIMERLKTEYEWLQRELKDPDDDLTDAVYKEEDWNTRQSNKLYNEIEALRYAVNRMQADERDEFNRLRRSNQRLLAANAELSERPLDKEKPSDG